MSLLLSLALSTSPATAATPEDIKILCEVSKARENPTLSQLVQQEAHFYTCVHPEGEYVEAIINVDWTTPPSKNVNGLTLTYNDTPDRMQVMYDYNRDGIVDFATWAIADDGKLVYITPYTAYGKPNAVNTSPDLSSMQYITWQMRLDAVIKSWMSRVR